MLFRKKASRSNGRSARQQRAAPSIIGGDVVIEGSVVTAGDLQVEGTIHGDVRAATVVVGPQGTIHGEVSGDDIAVRGRVIGPIRGLRVRVFAGAHVDGDIVHDSLAVETGAFCQGNIRRSEETFDQHNDQGSVHPHDVEMSVEDEDEPRRPLRRPIMLRSRAAE